MIRNILVPLDGHPFGENALPMAITLARRADAPIRLLHVLQPFVEVVPELSAYPGTIDADYRLEKQNYLDDVMNRIRKVSDVRVTAEVLEGEIAATIREVAEEERFDLVVMTTHGRGPVARFWLGSVADELVRAMPVPLLLIHPGAEAPALDEEPELKNVLLPLDGTPLAEQMVGPAVDLAKLMKAECVLFRVLRTDLPPDFGYQYRGGFVTTHAREMVAELERIQLKQKTDAETYLESVADRVRAMGVAARTRVVLDEKPAAAILEEAKWVDLVALETHGYRGLKRLWLGSVADKVIRGSHVPVLVQRPKT